MNEIDINKLDKSYYESHVVYFINQTHFLCSLRDLLRHQYNQITGKTPNAVTLGDFLLQQIDSINKSIIETDEQLRLLMKQYELTSRDVSNIYLAYQEWLSKETTKNE
jgi:hypothetical protein